jgi:aspartyl-tRNA(Asn)/glutamyl-tRNA(Gln) amidotransferase subunit B
MSADHPRYDVVIGLEVHTQLRTESKLFSPAPVSWGEAPNHSVHPVCLALPGVLPVLNKRAVELAIRAGLATHCEVRPRSVFARKNYFYPDLPKGYQISQYEEPVCEHGWLDVPVEENGESRVKRIGITRIHMEEDAGKSIHDASVTGGESTHVDLNRAGVPLVEIVSEPDLRSAAEAVAYLRTLRSILRYIGVSDADMEKGNFRCDANVSIRLPGAEAFGTRTELKNLNSFRSVELAIKAEVMRQAELLDDGLEVVQATMGYDVARDRTRVLRLKENADDYRYFPDPDLVPLLLDPAHIEQIRSALPELADARAERFRLDFGLPEYEAALLTENRALADFFEAALPEGGDARVVANWILRDVLGALNEHELEIEDSGLSPESLTALISLVDQGRTTAKSARSLIPELVTQGGDPAALVSERGLEAVTDSVTLEGVVDEVIAENPDDFEKLQAGEQKVINFLMGQVMKKTRGKADPAAVRKILADRVG